MSRRLRRDFQSKAERRGVDRSWRQDAEQEEDEVLLFPFYGGAMGNGVSVGCDNVVYQSDVRYVVVQLASKTD